MSNTELPSGPPWSLDVVADVHAGVHPPEVTQRLRALMADDPEAASMLAALDTVVDDLSLLPAPVMPAEYVSRLDAALLAEAHTRDSTAAGPATVSPIRPLAAVERPAPVGGPAVPGPVLPPPTVPPGVGDLAKARRRRQGFFAAVGAVAAAAAIGTIVVTTLPGSNSGTGAPADTDTQAGIQAPVNALKYFVVLDNGIATTVQIDDRAGCLQALDVPRDSVLVIADGELKGQDVSLVVTSDLGDEPADPDRVRTIVVEQGCSADGARIVQENTTAR